jgi:hypothetical protein
MTSSYENVIQLIRLSLHFLMAHQLPRQTRGNVFDDFVLTDEMMKMWNQMGVVGNSSDLAETLTHRRPSAKRLTRTAQIEWN